MTQGQATKRYFSRLSEHRRPDCKSVLPILTYPIHARNFHDMPQENNTFIPQTHFPPRNYLHQTSLPYSNLDAQYLLAG